MEPFGTDHCRYTRGFTLIELLLVIAMLLILVGLLLPSLTNVRTQARVASTKATLSAIETGLASLKADANIGGGYPPSRSDIGDGALVVNPHTPGLLQDQLAYPGGSPDGGLSGAALLLWALAGADLQGPPGFRDLNGDGYWGNNTGGPGTGDDDNALYSMDTSGPTAVPYHTRYGPYVDMEKMNVSPRARDTAGDYLDHFTIEAGPDTDIGTPVFLDPFGFPILYWRADRSGTEAVDTDPADAVVGIYRFEDNRCYTGEENNSTYPGIDLGAGTGHKIKNPIPGGGLPPDPGQFNLPADRDTFAYFIHDPVVSVNLLPKNRQSYLLISPGPDALYGTGDDVTNFEKNR